MGKGLNAGFVYINIMEEEKSTHLLFDGKKMIISPDIMPVFSFLMEIEKEIENILGFNKKLDDIKINYLEMSEFVLFLSDIIKKNNLDFKYNFKEHPEKIADKLTFTFPIRSQVIVLFASLDVLYNLHTAYEKQTTDKGILRELTMNTDNTKKFLNQFLLTEENKYYKDNKVRFSKIDSTKLRHLRNSLTHFFSIGSGGLSLAPRLLDEKTRNFEKVLKQNKKGYIVFTSPEDLYGLIKEANMLRMKKWSEDFKNDSRDFKTRIQSVIDLVKKEGAVILHNNNLNL